MSRALAINPSNDNQMVQIRASHMPGPSIGDEFVLKLANGLID